MDPQRLERIRARVLVTVAAGTLASVGCERTPEHTINRPPTVHVPPTINTPAVHTPPDVPHAIDPATPPGPTNAPMRVISDAGIAPSRPLEPEPAIPLPIPTANPPAPVRPRMPPGNG